MTSQLQTLGWSDALATTFHSLFPADSSSPLVPARVVRQDAGLLHVHSERGVCLAQASGRLRHLPSAAEALPVIGDWVALHLPPGADSRTHGRIEAVLPRRSLLIRRGSDDGRSGQPMAANVDRVLVVVAMDKEPNLRWLERALTVVWDSGAHPLVLLNKWDLLDDESVLASVRSGLPGVEVLPVSAHSGLGMEVVEQQLVPGETAVMLGSSGAGKSSLANRLLGEEAWATSAVREEDAKGRHTTTHRELRRVPGGALLIDGPGIRELGLWGSQADTLESVFPEIEALAAGCRFRDCRHQDEPGCAVRQAVEAGTLEADRWESYRKLRREQDWLDATATSEGRANLKRRNRLLTQSAWTSSRAKRRGD